MTPKMRLCLLHLAIVLAGLFCSGQQPGQSPAQKYFTDTILVDQNGKEQRFYTDLIKGKVVVISPMYTTCKDSCPMLTANLARIQKSLGPQLESNARLLSITVDPETDTPPVLKEYCSHFDAKPGWYFLTGKKENVELVLRRLGLYAEQKQEHLNLFLIGNDRTGLWKKALGVAEPQKLIEMVQSVLEDGQQPTSPLPEK